MSRKELPRLVARRTPEIEALLQEIWLLRPDLADKSKLTVFLSLGAFAREEKGVARLPSAVPEQPTANRAIAEAQLAVPTETKEPLEEKPVSPPEVNNISDDVEWD